MKVRGKITAYGGDFNDRTVDNVPAATTDEQPVNKLQLEDEITALQDQIGVYTHDQSVASMTWSINHNLNKNPPAVQVVDSAGTECEGVTTYDDLDNLTIRFSAPFSGKAYIN